MRPLPPTRVNILSYINGNKTYIVGGATILYAALGMALGHVDQETGMQMVFGALAAMGIRHGIATSKPQ